MNTDTDWEGLRPHHPTEAGTRTAKEGHILQTTKRSNAWHILTNI